MNEKNKLGFKIVIILALLSMLVLAIAPVLNAIIYS